MFSIKDAIYSGFAKTINNFGLFIVAQIIRFVFFFICGYVLIYVVYGTFNLNAIPQGEAAAEYARNLPQYKGFIALGIMFLMYVIHRIFVLGITNVSLDLVAQRPTSLYEIVSKWYLVGWDLVIRAGLFGLMIISIVGSNIIIDKLGLPIKFYPFQLTIALIIIGLIVVRCCFARTILVDQECSALSALSQSYQITSGHVLHLINFWLMVGLTKLINIVPFGSFITLPVASIAQVEAYKALSTQRN